MKKTLILLIFLPVLTFGQLMVSGGGSSLDLTTLLPIISDSTLWHLQGADTLVTDGALPIKVSGIRVSGTTRLDGTLTLITTASESLLIAAGGIRNEGGLIQKGNSSFGVLAVPKSTVQITGMGISAVNYYKGLRLSNPDAATNGVQAVSPVLLFRGAGYKTGYSSSDSVLWAIYIVPSQGGATTSSMLYFDSKVGSGGWANKATLSSGGDFVTGSVKASLHYVTSGDIELDGEDNTYIVIDNNNNDSDTRAVIFGKNGFGATSEEIARLTESGKFGVGTNNPLEEIHAKVEVVIEESGAGEKKWRLQTDPTTGKLEFYFRNTASWIKKASIDTTGGYTDEY
jgi:hypothetical protein